VERTQQERQMALTKTERVSEAEFRRLSLDDPQGRWELYRGQLRERPGMSVSHGRVMDRLLSQLYSQLDLAVFGVRTQHARLRIYSDTYYIPDIAVIPIDMERILLENPRSLDAYPEPLPLVVEIWSPSTRNYDDNEKLRAYQQRGDLEIWRIHPYERTLTAWRRQPDGAYFETMYREGVVHLAALPAVVIDVAALFGL
jgi:Uma2 family endonuclease